MRAALALLALVVALSTLPAAGATAGSSPATRGEGLSVLVELQRPPLAASGQLRRLPGSSEPDLRSLQARRALSAIAREQERAEATLRERLPNARVRSRHSLLLNAIALELPAGELGRLARVVDVRRIYPNLTYRPLVDQGRAVIGADRLESTTGATGAGVKIAIVDDGIDVNHPMFAPDGFAYPDGFPRGARAHVSPKVIVARSFPAPGAGRAARRAFDRNASFHGTHVAGIAAGNELAAPAGSKHPRIASLRGVAPGAQLGNYRVFTTPTELGNVATTAQVVAAFESAVRDGMDIINFSGGGPEIDARSDALVRAIGIATRAGVTVVVSAGNSGDALGSGSVTSPAVAPEAIAVGAVTSSRVFGPALSALGKRADELSGIPYATPFGLPLPRRLTRTPVELRPVEAIVGRRGTNVRAELCAPRGEPSRPGSDLPKRSLRGEVALVGRGICTIASKVERARRAGARAVVLIDNRPGEPAAPATFSSIPLLVVSDLDGARLVEAALAAGGVVDVRLGRGPAALNVDRSGVVAPFSSTGPTAFGHRLKPDLSAPGMSILSATNSTLGGSDFDVLSGTSMAAPHVAGSAALLLELHPGWAPWELKSALVSTATGAWADTMRSVPAPPAHAGGGTIAVDRASAPRIFALPTTLSLGDLRVSATRGASESAEIAISDAGGGTGAWSVEVETLEAPAGVMLSATPAIALDAGGPASIVVSALVPAGTASGALQGFVRLSSAGETRSIPFYGFVTNPRLAGLPVTTLRSRGRGTTADSASAVERYGFPSAPFGPPPTPGASPMRETGGERLFRFDVPRGTVNAGVAVVPQQPGVAVDPFILGSRDEHAVLGLAATPVTGNGLLPSVGARDGAAAVLFPQPGRYWVAVDSGLDPRTRRGAGGAYRIRHWIDDVQPPRLELLTRRLARGHGTIAVRATDAGSGVDPLTLTLRYLDLELAPARYDHDNGLALFRIPRALPRLPRGSIRIVMRASDHQEAKNILATSRVFLPNTAERATRLLVDESRAHIAWLAPAKGRCAPAGGRVTLTVAATGPEPVRAVRFLVAGRPVALDRRPRFGDIFETAWNVPADSSGRLRVLAEAVSPNGARLQRRASHVRICKQPV